MSDSTAPPQAGRFDAQVVAAFGRHLEVRDGGGRRFAARPFGRRLIAVCGDQVRCAHDAHHREVHVLEVLPRRSCLYRSSAQGEPEPIAANLSRLVVVLAPAPLPDLYVVDRYLCAAASAGIAAALALNKCELPADESLRAELAVFLGIGYPVVQCSAQRAIGIDALRALCASGSAALVGQSGVGKSSLVQQLAPQAGVVTGELLRTGEGRHTTTASRLYDLAGGGELIDSPGVRDFAPSIDQLEPRSLGFPEVERLAPQCRFSDCRHLREPGCAVRAAVDSGAMGARRYESYRRLRRLRETLTAARGPKRRS